MPMRPSWVDRLFRWLERLPGPTWVTYLAIYVIAVVLIHLAIWIDGAEPWATIVPGRIVDGAWAVLPLGFIHYLSNASLRAMDEFEILLERHPARVQALRTRLSFMSASPVLWLSIPAAIAAAWLIVTRNVFIYEGGPESAGSIALVLLVAVLPWTLFPILGYFVIRLLGSIRAAYRALDTVSIYRQQPLNAFAGVALRASLLWIAVANLNVVAVAIDPTTTTISGVEFLLQIAAIVMAVITFLVPLVGVHRRLRAARAAALDENGRHLDELNRRLYASLGIATADDLQALDRSLATLQRVRDDVRQQRTWPWDAATLRAFLSAVILPLVVWGLQNWLSGLI